MAELRPVFYVSDGTGITAETIGHSLLTQFGGLRFATDRLLFVDSLDKARQTAEKIRQAGIAHGLRPIVVNSCVDPALNAILAESGALMLDVFAPFIEPLERELGQQRESHVGRAHGMVDFDTYDRRINAMNYALAHDDGVGADYSDADLILVGVSRAGKTPTCVYLALHYGICAADSPLSEEDLESDALPARSRPYRRKLCGQAPHLRLPGAALRHLRGELPADRGRPGVGRAAGAAAPVPAQAVRADHRSAAPAPDPPATAAGFALCAAGYLQARSRGGGGL